MRRYFSVHRSNSKCNDLWCNRNLERKATKIKPKARHQFSTTKITSLIFINEASINQFIIRMPIWCDDLLTNLPSKASKSIQYCLIPFFISRSTNWNSIIVLFTKLCCWIDHQCIIAKWPTKNWKIWCAKLKKRKVCSATCKLTSLNCSYLCVSHIREHFWAFVVQIKLTSSSSAPSNEL